MMEITSPSFSDNEKIPARYTCDDINISPPFEWTEVPTDAQTLAIIISDPDATDGTYYHWVIWNIESGFDGIGEGESTIDAVEGLSSNGTPGYTGPCPPPGEEHRYFIRLYALPEKLSFDEDLPAEVAVEKISESAVESAEMMGIYGR